MVHVLRECYHCQRRPGLKSLEVGGQSLGLDMGLDLGFDFTLCFRVVREEGQRALAESTVRCAGGAIR